MLRGLVLEETTYGWAVEMIVKGTMAGFRVVEVPVSYYRRIGKSKISGTLKGTMGGRLVHFQFDCALLFPATKSRDTQGSVSPHRIAMQSSRENVVRSSSGDRVLVIIAKAPRPGSVKTRLASCHSTAALTDFYSCLLQDTLAVARSLSDVEVAMMCPSSDVSELAQLAGNDSTVITQEGEGLAAGLTSVFAHFPADHQRIIAFNSDSPHLPRSVLENAFETLAAHDVVVGPTHDGGYYLVGTKAIHPTLFANDGMGSSSALKRLLSHARDLDLSVGFADPFYDIDVADDLTRLAEELRMAPARAQRTARGSKSGNSRGSYGRAREHCEYPRCVESVLAWRRVVHSANNLLALLR